MVIILNIKLEGWTESIAGGVNGWIILRGGW